MSEEFPSWRPFLTAIIVLVLGAVLGVGGLAWGVWAVLRWAVS